MKGSELIELTLTNFTRKTIILIPFAVMMAKRKMSLNELSEKVDITLSNLSILKTGKAKAVRFSNLEAICKALDCQPGEILEFVDSEDT